MNRLILLLATFFCLHLYAQNGYQLQFNFKKAATDSLDISIYFGTTSKTYTIASLSTQSKKGIDQQTQKIIPALYRLNLKGADEKDYINISVDNGDQLEFTLHENYIQSITTTDPLNSLFIEAQKSFVRQERKSMFEKIVQQYPNSAAALYAILELKQMEKVPTYSTANDSLIQFQNSYFESIDLNDKRLPLLPNIYSSLYDYVRLRPINSENYSAAIDHLMIGQDCNSTNYVFYMKWIFMNLEYLNRYHLYDAYLHVFNQYLNQGECIVQDEKFYNQIVTRLQNYEKVPIGSEIPNFKMVDQAKKTIYISEIYPKHSYTFIAFYDPDCSHCKEKMPEINTYFQELKAKSDIDIQQVAFLNAESDYAWTYFIEKNELTQWLHVKNEDPTLQYIKDLDVFANPSFFLVDQKGTIIMKNFNPKEMNLLFKVQP